MHRRRASALTALTVGDAVLLGALGLALGFGVVATGERHEALSETHGEPVARNSVED